MFLWHMQSLVSDFSEWLNPWMNTWAQMTFIMLNGLIATSLCNYQVASEINSGFLQQKESQGKYILEWIFLSFNFTHSLSLPPSRLSCCMFPFHTITALFSSFISSFIPHQSRSLSFHYAHSFMLLFLFLHCSLSFCSSYISYVRSLTLFADRISFHVTDQYPPLLCSLDGWREAHQTFVMPSLPRQRPPGRSFICLTLSRRIKDTFL